MNKLCPKCKCKWSDNIDYCICGEKLSIFNYDALFGDDTYGIKEMFTNAVNKKKEKK